MKDLILLLLLSLCLFPRFVYAQNSSDYQPVTDALAAMGMENIALAEDNHILRISYDDPVYRSNAQGAYEVIKTLLANPGVNTRIHLILKEEQIPRALIQIPADAIAQYRNDKYTMEDVMKSVVIGQDTRTETLRMRGVKEKNKSFGKIDIVFYPQISLRNAWMDKLYGAVFNIAPAVEMGLWKGASFTGQVIFPIWNNMTGQMDYIRAGMLLFRQQYHLFSRIQTTFSIGNFTNNRIGADIRLNYYSDNGRWRIGAQTGLTGFSTFYQGRWEVSKWKRISGNLNVRYHEPIYNLDFDLAAHRYIYGDYGVRMDCSRHFGEVTVGVYAMQSGGEYNGGFHFAIPLSPKKQSKRRAIRVRLPQYYDWEYEAQSGNEYAERLLGRYYEVRPDENRSQFYFNSDYLKSSLIHFSRREQSALK